MTDKQERDIEKGYSKTDFVAKLRRLADAIENGDRFDIQIAGERIYVPVRAEFTIEHERSDDEEEIDLGDDVCNKPLAFVLTFRNPLTSNQPRQMDNLLMLVWPE